MNSTLTFEQKKNNLAHIACSLGVNIQPGQTLVVNAPVESADFARLVAKNAFELGAKDVSIRYNDEHFSRLRYDHADLEALTTIPKWQQDRLNDYVDQNTAVISIYAENPDVMKGVDTSKVLAATRLLRLLEKGIRRP